MFGSGLTRSFGNQLVELLRFSCSTWLLGVEVL